MASWNELAEGEQLEPCPVCAVKVSKKRRTYHLTKCSERYEHFMTEIDVIRCPLYQLHILPKKYLNHHLEGNCEEAYNMLRKFMQKIELQKQFKNPPPHFLANVPDDVLNFNNKKLLFMLQRDINGKDISGDQSLYPTETDSDINREDETID